MSSVIDRKVAVWLHDDGDIAKRPRRHWIHLKDVASICKGQPLEVAVVALYEVLLQTIEALERKVDNGDSDTEVHVQASVPGQDVRETE